MPEAERRVDHVVLVVLGQRAGLEHVPAARVDEIALRAEHVLHQPQVAGALRPEAPQAADVDVAHAVARGDEDRQRRRGVGLDVLADARAAEADAAVLTVFGDRMRRYSAVKNWLREMKLRGNCG